MREHLWRLSTTRVIVGQISSLTHRKVFPLSPSVVPFVHPKFKLHWILCQKFHSPQLFNHVSFSMWKSGTPSQLRDYLLALLGLSKHYPFTPPVSPLIGLWYFKKRAPIVRMVYIWFCRKPPTFIKYHTWIGVFPSLLLSSWKTSTWEHLWLPSNLRKHSDTHPRYSPPCIKSH